MKLKQQIKQLIDYEKNQPYTDRQNRANNFARAFFYDDNNDNNQNIRQWLWGDNPQDDSNGILDKIDGVDHEIPQRLKNYTTYNNSSLIAKDQALLQALHSLPLSSDDTKQKLIGILVRTSPSRDNYINPKHNTGLASIFDQHVKHQSKNFQKRFFNSIKQNELVSDTDFRKVIHRLYFKYLLKNNHKNTYENKASWLANFLFNITVSDGRGLSTPASSLQEQRRDNWLATYEELKNARPSPNTGGAAASSTEPSQSELQSTPLLQDFVAESVKYADQRQVNNFDAIQRIYSLLAECPTDQRQKLHRFNKILKNQQQSINIRQTLFARDSDQFLYPALIHAWDKVANNKTARQKFAANLANILRELNEDQLKQLNSICQETGAPSADIIHYFGQTDDKQSNLNKLKTIEQRRPHYLKLFYSATQNHFIFTSTHIDQLLDKLHQLANKPSRLSWVPSSISAFNDFYTDLLGDNNNFLQDSKPLSGISIMLSYDDFANHPHDTVKRWQERFNTISQLIQDSSFTEQLHGLYDETLRQEAHLIARMEGEDHFQKMTQVYQKLNQIDGNERKIAAYQLNHSLLDTFKLYARNEPDLDAFYQFRNTLFTIENQNQLKYDAIIDLHNKSHADGGNYQAKNHLDELIVNQRNNLDNLDKINQIARVLTRLHSEDQTALETKIQQLKTDKLDTQLNDYCLDFILSNKNNKDAIKNWLNGEQTPLADNNLKQAYYHHIQQTITQPNEPDTQIIESQANILDKLYQISDQDSINQPTQTILSHFNLLSSNEANLALNNIASCYRLAIQLQLKQHEIQPSTITDALNHFDEQPLINIHNQLQQTTATNWNHVKQSLNDTANTSKPFLTKLYLHLLSANFDHISVQDRHYYFNYFKNCVPNTDDQLVLPSVDTLQTIYKELFDTTRQYPSNNHQPLFKTISQYLFLPEQERPDNFKSEQNIIDNLNTLNHQDAASTFGDLQQYKSDGDILSQANIDFIQDLSQNSQNHTDDKQNVCRLYSNLAHSNTEIRQQAFQFNHESRQQLPAEKRLAIFSVHNYQLQYPAITQRYNQLGSIDNNAQQHLMDALNQNDLTSDYLSQMNTICQLRLNIQSQNRDQDSELESFVQLENEGPFNKDTLVNLYLKYLLIQTNHQNWFNDFKNWVAQILSNPRDKDNFAKQLSYLLTPDIDQQHHKKVYGLLNALYKLRQNQNQNQYLNDSTIRTLLTQVPFHSDDQQTGLANIIWDLANQGRSQLYLTKLISFLNKVATRYESCNNLDQIDWEYRIDRLLLEQDKSQQDTAQAASALLNDTQLQKTFYEIYSSLPHNINQQKQSSLTKAVVSILAHETQATDRHTRLQIFRDIFDIIKQQPDEQQQAIYDELPNHLSNLEQAKLETTNNGLDFYKNYLMLDYFPAPPRGLAANTWISAFCQFANTLNQALQAIDQNKVNNKQKRSLENFIKQFPSNGPRNQTNNQTLLYYSMVARSPVGYDNQNWQQVIEQWQKDCQQFNYLPHNIEPIIFDVLATRDQNIENLAQFYNNLNQRQQLFNQALQQNDVNFTARQTIINHPSLADLYQLTNTDGAKNALIHLLKNVNQDNPKLDKLNQIACVLTRLHSTNTQEDQTALENKIKELETNNLDTQLNQYCLDYVQQQCHENYRNSISNLRQGNITSTDNWQTTCSKLQYVAEPDNNPTKEQINQHAAFLAGLYEAQAKPNPAHQIEGKSILGVGQGSQLKPSNNKLHNLLKLFAEEPQHQWLSVHKTLYDQKTSQPQNTHPPAASAAAAGAAAGATNTNYDNAPQALPTHAELLWDLATEDKKPVTQFYASLAQPNTGKPYQQLHSKLINLDFTFQTISTSTLGKIFNQQLIDNNYLQQLNDKLSQPTINQGNVVDYIYLAAILSQANFEANNRPLDSFDNLLSDFGHTKQFSELLTNILNSNNNTLEQYRAFLEAIYTHHQVLNNRQVYQLIRLFNQPSNIQWLQPINDLNTDNRSVALQDYLQELSNPSQQAIANTYQLYSHLSQTDNHLAIDVNHNLRKPKAGRKKKNPKFNSQLRLRFLQNDPLVNFYHNKLHNNPTIKEKFHGVLQTLEFNNYFEDFSELINDERLYNHHYTQLINDLANNTSQLSTVINFYKNLTNLNDATDKQNAFKLNQVLQDNDVDFNKRQTILKTDNQNQLAYPAIIKLNSDNHTSIISTLKSSTEQQFSVINDICQICFNNNLRFPQSTELRYRSEHQHYQLDDSKLIKACRQLAIRALFDENSSLSYWLLDQLDNEQYNNMDHQLLNLAKTPENPGIAIPFIDFIEDLHQQSSSLNDHQITTVLQHLNQTCSSNNNLQAFLDLVSDTLNNEQQKVNFLKDLATIHPGNENGIQQLAQLYNHLTQANETQRQFHNILFREGFSYTKRADILRYQSIIDKTHNLTETAQVKLAYLLSQATQNETIRNLASTITQQNLNELQLTVLVNYLINNQNNINSQNIEKIGHAVSQRALPAFLDLNQLNDAAPLKQYLHKASNEQLPHRLAVINALNNTAAALIDDNQVNEEQTQLRQYQALLAQLDRDYAQLDTYVQNLDNNQIATNFDQLLQHTNTATNHNDYNPQSKEDLDKTLQILQKPNAHTLLNNSNIQLSQFDQQQLRNLTSSDFQAINRLQDQTANKTTIAIYLLATNQHTQYPINRLDQLTDEQLQTLASSLTNNDTQNDLTKYLTDLEVDIILHPAKIVFYQTPHFNNELISHLKNKAKSLELSNQQELSERLRASSNSNNNQNGFLSHDHDFLKTLAELSRRDNLHINSALNQFKNTSAHENQAPQWLTKISDIQDSAKQPYVQELLTYFDQQNNIPDELIDFYTQNFASSEQVDNQYKLHLNQQLIQSNCSYDQRRQHLSTPEFNNLYNRLNDTAKNKLIPIIGNITTENNTEQINKLTRIASALIKLHPNNDPNNPHALSEKVNDLAVDKLDDKLTEHRIDLLLASLTELDNDVKQDTNNWLRNTDNTDQLQLNTLLTNILNSNNTLKQHYATLFRHLASTELELEQKQVLLNKLYHSDQPDHSESEHRNEWLSIHHQLYNIDSAYAQRFLQDSLTDDNQVRFGLVVEFYKPLYNSIDSSRLTLNNETDLPYTTRQELFKVNQQNKFTYKELHHQYSLINDYSNLIDGSDQKDNFVKLLHHARYIQKLPQLNRIFEQASQNPDLDSRAFRDSLLQDYQNNSEHIQTVIEFYQKLVNQDQNIVAELCNINSNLVQNSINFNTRQTLFSKNPDNAYDYPAILDLYQQLLSTSSASSENNPASFFRQIIQNSYNQNKLQVLNSWAQLMLTKEEGQQNSINTFLAHIQNLMNTDSFIDHYINTNHLIGFILREHQVSRSLINWLQSDPNSPITDANRDAFYRRLQNAVQSGNQAVLQQDAAFLQAIYDNGDNLERYNKQRLIQLFNNSDNQQPSDWLQYIDNNILQSIKTNYLKDIAANTNQPKLTQAIYKLVSHLTSQDSFELLKQPLLLSLNRLNHNTKNQFLARIQPILDSPNTDQSQNDITFIKQICFLQSINQVTKAQALSKFTNYTQNDPPNWLNAINAIQENQRKPFVKDLISPIFLETRSQDDLIQFYNTHFHIDLESNSNKNNLNQCLTNNQPKITPAQKNRLFGYEAIVEWAQRAYRTEGINQQILTQLLYQISTNEQRLSNFNSLINKLNNPSSIESQQLVNCLTQNPDQLDIKLGQAAQLDSSIKIKTLLEVAQLSSDHHLRIYTEQALQKSNQIFQKRIKSILLKRHNNLDLSLIDDLNTTESKLTKFHNLISQINHETLDQLIEQNSYKVIDLLLDNPVLQQANARQLHTINQVFTQASQNSELDSRAFQDSLLQDCQNNPDHIQTVIEFYQKLVNQDQNIVAELCNINSNLVQNSVNFNTRQTLFSKNPDNAYNYPAILDLYQQLLSTSSASSENNPANFFRQIIQNCYNKNKLDELNSWAALMLIRESDNTIDLAVAENPIASANSFINTRLTQHSLLSLYLQHTLSSLDRSGDQSPQPIINWLQLDVNSPITNDNRDAFYRRLQNADQSGKQAVLQQDAAFLQAIYDNRDNLEPEKTQTLINQFNRSHSQHTTDWLVIIKDFPSIRYQLLNYLSDNNFETRNQAIQSAYNYQGLLSFLNIVNDQPKKLDKLKDALNQPSNPLHFKKVLRAAMSIDQSLWSSLNELLKPGSYATNKFDQFMYNLTLWEDPQDEREFDKQRYQYKLGLTQVLSQDNPPNPNIDRFRCLNYIVALSESLKLTPKLMSLSAFTDRQLQTIADSLDRISEPQATHQSQYFRRQTPLAKLQDILSNNPNIHNDVGSQYLWWQQIAQAPIEAGTEHPNRLMDQWTNNVRKPSDQNRDTANLMQWLNEIYWEQSPDAQHSELNTDQLLAVIQNQDKLRNLVDIVNNYFKAYHSHDEQQKFDNLKPIIRDYINADDTTKDRLNTFLKSKDLSTKNPSELLQEFEQQENEARSSRSYSSASNPANNLHTFFESWQKIAPDPTASPGGHHLQGDINWSQFEKSLKHILADEKEEEAEHYKYCHIYHNDQPHAKYYKRDGEITREGKYDKEKVTNIVFNNSDNSEDKKDNERIELHIQGRDNNHIEKLPAKDKPDTQYHVQDILRITEIARSTGHDGIEVTGYNLRNEARIDLTDELPEELQKELNSRDKVAIKAPVFAYAMAQATKLSTFGYDRSQRQFVSDDDPKDNAVLKAIANKYYGQEIKDGHTNISTFVQEKLKPIVDNLKHYTDEIQTECQKYTPDDDVDETLSKTPSMSYPSGSGLSH